MRREKLTCFMVKALNIYSFESNQHALRDYQNKILIKMLYSCQPMCSNFGKYLLESRFFKLWLVQLNSFLGYNRLYNKVYFNIHSTPNQLPVYHISIQCNYVLLYLLILRKKVISMYLQEKSLLIIVADCNFTFYIYKTYIIINQTYST